MNDMILVRCPRKMLAGASFVLSENTGGFVHEWIQDDAHYVTDHATDTGSGTAIDLTQTGTGITSQTFTGPIYSSQGRGFDGVDIISSTTSAFDWNSGSFSWTGWVFITNNAVVGSGLSEQGYFTCNQTGDATDFLRIHNLSASAGAVRCITSGTGIVTAAGAVANSTWTHVGYTNSGGGSGGTMKIYINGTSVSTSASSSGSIDPAVYTMIGARGPNGTGNLTGRCHRCRIFNRLLSDAEMMAVKNLTAP